MFNNKDAQPAQEQEQDGADFDFFNQLLASIDNQEEKADGKTQSETSKVTEDLYESQVLKIPP